MENFDLEAIRSRVPGEELLAGLAEEAAELAQAALKYRRALDGTNPTPMPPKEAETELMEEVADVLLYLGVLGYVSGMTTLAAIAGTTEDKLRRWGERLA